MKLRPAISLTIFALFIVLSVGRNIPAFRLAMQSLPFKPLIGIVCGIVILVLTNGMTVYQLWTGKASTWDWSSPKNGYQGWLLRSQHPFSYWARVLLWLVLAIVFDMGLILIVEGKGPPEWR